MPLRSFSALRRWLAPWASAAVVLTALVLTVAGPPLELWPSMLGIALLVLLLAGSLAALLFSAAASLLRMPPGSRGALGLAAMAGATVPFLPGAPVIGGAVFSLAVYAALALVAAWRVAPAEVAEMRVRSLLTSSTRTQGQLS